jgi:hypothetical protein
MEKCLRASQHTTSHRYSNYIFSCASNCTGTIEYLYCILNVYYMFRCYLCHPLITSQKHLLIVRLSYNGYITKHEIYIYIHIIRGVFGK